MTIYGQSVRFSSDWLAAQGREPVLAELTRVRDWLAQLPDRNEATTVKTRYRGLLRFCGWLVDEEELVDNPICTLSPLEPKPTPVRCSALPSPRARCPAAASSPCLPVGPV